MVKNYVLDTNVMIHDTNSIFNFQDNNVIIPIKAIDELDGLKRKNDTVGRNARQVLRSIDALREHGDLSKGVPLGEGTFRVELNHRNTPGLSKDLDPDLADNRILSVCIAMNLESPTILVSNDLGLRIKATTHGLVAQSYETGRVDVDELIAQDVIEVESWQIDELYKKKGTAVEGEWFANQCVLLVSGSQSAPVRYNAKKKCFMPVLTTKGVWGIQPKNLEQQFALDLLLDDSVKLVTLIGIAGSGKTLCSLAAGLSKVEDGLTYTKLIVARPTVAMGGGEGLGFLPGDIDEKLKPWMQPIFDNLDFLMGDGGRKKASRYATPERKHYEDLIEQGILEIEALQYIRGRSMPRVYIIIDEAQNLTPMEVKTIITRAGEGSKVILVGDVSQIDSAHLDAETNGLVYVAERFKGENIAGNVILTKGERSELAEIAARVL